MEELVNNNFWQDKNVLITGATGFVGSWLTKSLIEKKANVKSVVRDKIHNSNFFLSGINKKNSLVYGNIEDYNFINRIMNEHEIDTVFHLAAQAIVQTANRNPLSTFKANIEGTWNILEAARNNKLIQGVIVASSDKAYGEHKILPYTEDLPLQGAYPYDVSKSCADLLTQSYYKTYGLPTCITRCANMYGGGDLNFSRIIPGIIKAILKNKDFIIRSDGTLERDYMYVEDGANAYLTIGENIHKQNIKGESFNFGTETPVSVLELFEKVKFALNSNISAQVLGEAKGEINKQFLGCEKARTKLNWKIQYNLNTGIRKTFEWYKKYENKVIL
jgi:CDP-glucose 4,6-dehydratase